MGVARMIPASQGDFETPSMRSSLRTLQSYGAVIPSAVYRGRIAFIRPTESGEELARYSAGTAPGIGRYLAICTFLVRMSERKTEDSIFCECEPEPCFIAKDLSVKASHLLPPIPETKWPLVRPASLTPAAE
jgi:hypothetical protein